MSPLDLYEHGFRVLKMLLTTWSLSQLVRGLFTHIRKEYSAKSQSQTEKIDVLREIISRLSNPEDIVVDIFGGTLSTAVACMKI